MQTCIIITEYMHISAGLQTTAEIVRDMHVTAEHFQQMYEVVGYINISAGL